MTHYSQYLRGSEIGTHGRPRHISKEDWFWSRVSKDGPAPAHCPELGPCWPWTGQVDPKGYGKATTIVIDGKEETLAHRVAFLLTYGPLPEGKPIVMHKCDNPPCANPAHGRAGTVLENVADRQAKRRQAQGVTHASHKPFDGKRRWNRKLSEQDVAEIRARYRPRVVTHGDLAAAYGVSRAAIKDVLSGRTWST